MGSTIEIAGEAMLFRQIQIRNFRKLESPLVIGGIGDGLTIIAGDNEDGKSTLLDAIRAGLFERHKLGGAGLARMQPFGSRVRPEIRLDFEINGEAYILHKIFGSSPSVRFETPNGNFDAEHAEEKLAELLTFRAARGESKPDDRGILGLFWLEQGRSLERLAFGETGRLTLRASFEREVGDVLGGDRGRRLLRAAMAKRDELLTATGRPKAHGELANAIAEAEAATRRAEQLNRERIEYDSEIDELVRVQADLAQIEAEGRVNEARKILTELEAEAKRIDELRHGDDVARNAVSLAEAELCNASERWARRRGLIDASETRATDLTAAQNALSELEGRADEIDRSYNEARARADNAASATNTVETRVKLAEARARRAALDEEIDELNRRITEIGKLTTERAVAAGRLGAVRIDRPLLEEIEGQDSAIREAGAAIAAAATRLRFFPSDRQAVMRDGTTLPSAEAVEVTAPAHFTLEGFGALEVQPGGKVLAERRERLREAKVALAAALTSAEVANVAEARAQFEVREKAEDVICTADRLIRVYAPHGEAALLSACKVKCEERASLDLEIDLSTAPADLAEPGTERRALEAAKQAEATALTVAAEAERNRQQHFTDLAVARANFENAERNSTTAKQDLESARTEAADVDLAAALRSARDALATATDAKAWAEEELQAANPEEVEERHAQARRDLENIERVHRDLKDREIALENRLTGLDKGRIREELEEVREEQRRALSRRDRVQAEANAWRLVVETLEAAERDAKRAFLDPVRQCIRPFLEILFPGVDVTLQEESLEIAEIARNGRSEPYSALSVGTREQLSILVRLAFAVYLREKGYPAVVILDDALVYADPGRFARMQEALGEAAKKVQILLLTCRPEDWRPLGVPIRRLADAVTAFEPA